MYYAITAQKDASIYNQSASMNTGLDEILEIKKITALPTKWITRTLIKFDISDISASISAGTIPANHKFYLKLSATEPESSQIAYDVYAYPVSQSWTMGNGKFFNTPSTEEGVSWYYKTGVSVGDYWNSSSYTSYGGTWYTSSAGSQSFDYSAADINMDVTPIVNEWLSSSIANEGFMLKFSDAAESDNNTWGILKFFSTDTNTIFKPQLIVKWSDAVFSTGSLLAVSSSDNVFFVKNLRDKYSELSKERVRVVARGRYPVKTYANMFGYSTVQYLPSSSYYSVKDAYTGDTVVPFDDTYTKISCDSTGNYFDFWFNTLYSGRYYRFVFKVVHSDGSVQYFDNNYIFKVVR